VPSPTPFSRVEELSSEELAIYRKLDPNRMPRHVAIIMDGNGRWANQRSLKRFFGHQRGAEAVRGVTETAARIGLPYVTLYAFSLENNLRRPKAEVGFLMGLLKSYLAAEVKTMLRNNIRLTFIGRIQELPKDVQDIMTWASQATAANTGTTLTLALNYGGRSELVDAVRRIALQVAQSAAPEESAATVTEEDVARNLYTSQMPDPDLLIRTSGEQRVSNFLLWQIAYSEIFITERYWPDFRGTHLLEAIADYQGRERRYGGLGDTLEESTSDLVRT
jgi:undecaprenyl diphosphate synthase